MIWNRIAILLFMAFLANMTAQAADLNDHLSTLPRGTVLRTTEKIIIPANRARHVIADSKNWSCAIELRSSTKERRLPKGRAIRVKKTLVEFSGPNKVYIIVTTHSKQLRIDITNKRDFTKHDTITIGDLEGKLCDGKFRVAKLSHSRYIIP